MTHIVCAMALVVLTHIACAMAACDIKIAGANYVDASSGKVEIAWAFSKGGDAIATDSAGKKLKDVKLSEVQCLKDKSWTEGVDDVAAANYDGYKIAFAFEKGGDYVLCDEGGKKIKEGKVTDAPAVTDKGWGAGVKIAAANYMDGDTKEVGWGFVKGTEYMITDKGGKNIGEGKVGELKALQKKQWTTVDDVGAFNYQEGGKLEVGWVFRKGGEYLLADKGGLWIKSGKLSDIPALTSKGWTTDCTVPENSVADSELEAVKSKADTTWEAPVTSSSHAAYFSLATLAGMAVHFM